MSGFDSKRITAYGLSQMLFTHLKCGICLGIFNNPMDTVCEHTFCCECITEWMKTSNSCPKCRHSLVTSRTRPQNESQLKCNRLAKNIINDLKFKCYSDSNGCQQYVEIGSLSSHLEVCHKYLCETCGLKVGKTCEHNCLELMRNELKRVNEKLTQSQEQKNEWKRKFEEKSEELKSSKRFKNARLWGYRKEEEKDRESSEESNEDSNDDNRDDRDEEEEENNCNESESDSNDSIDYGMEYFKPKN